MTLNYREIAITIRNILINDSSLQSSLGVDSEEIKNRVRLGYLATIEDISYPRITFNLENIGITENQYSIYGECRFHIWTKDSLDTAHTFMNV